MKKILAWQNLGFLAVLILVIINPLLGFIASMIYAMFGVFYVD